VASSRALSSASSIRTLCEGAGGDTLALSIRHTKLIFFASLGSSRCSPSLGSSRCRRTAIIQAEDGVEEVIGERTQLVIYFLHHSNVIALQCLGSPLEIITFRSSIEDSFRENSHSGSLILPSGRSGNLLRQV
jgi:hypothetical protein